MLIYSTEFFFSPGERALGKIRESIKSWLNRKIGPAFRPVKIIPHGQPLRFQRQDTGSNVVTIIGTPDGAMPYSMTMSYQHNDRDVAGRAWITKIGFEQRDNTSQIHLTVVLETSEVSILANSPLDPTRPGIVPEILNNSELDNRTPGKAVKPPSQLEK